MSAAPTERVELALLAATSVLEHPDVLEGVAGPGGTLTTTIASRRLVGVSVAAAPGGGYDVVLRLRTRVVPLQELAAELRRGVFAASSACAYAGRPRSVEIQVADVGGRR